MGDSFWPTGFVLSLHCSTISEERYVGEDFSACPRQIRPACASQVPREGAVRDTSRDALRALSSPSTCVASRKFLARRLPRAPRPRHWRPRAALRWRSRRCVSPRHQLPDPWNWLCPPGDVFSPRARLRRASRRPPGFDRAEFASDCCRECSGRESERTRRRARSAHEDSTRGSPPIPGATQPSGRETSFARSRPRPGHIATRARARRPIAPRVFSPEVPSRYARKTRPDRDSRTPFSRGGFPAARSTASQLERRPARRNFSRLFLVCPNSRLTDTPIDPPYQSAGSWFRHFSRRRYPRARYRTRHGSRAQGARGSRGGEGFLRPLRLSQAGAYLAARPDRRQIPPNPPRRTRLEPCR